VEGRSIRLASGRTTQLIPHNAAAGPADGSDGWSAGDDSWTDLVFPISVQRTNRRLEKKEELRSGGNWWRLLPTKLVHPVDG
jgi:hypothetical protein